MESPFSTLHTPMRSSLPASATRQEDCGFVPEGDTVYLAAHRLARAIDGATLTKTDFRVPRIATADLTGRRVLEVTATGKHMLIRIEGGVTLHTHYKMEGSWHLYRHGERWRGPAFQVRALLVTDDWVAVGFRLAICDLIATTKEHEVVGHLGPDPLGSDWDPDLALENLSADLDRPIGDALLDQRVMAGPGNVYRCEICFLSGVDPRSAVGSIEDLGRVVDLTKRLMEANRFIGNQVTTGDRRPGFERWVYGRGGRPCRRCRTPIRSDIQDAWGGERVTYWCPACQVSAGGEVGNFGSLKSVGQRSR
jgi:endonuclease-8